MAGNDPNLKIRITGDLASISKSLSGLRTDFTAVSTAAKQTGREAAAGLATIEQAAKAAGEQLRKALSSKDNTGAREAERAAQSAARESARAAKQKQLEADKAAAAQQREQASIQQLIFSLRQQAAAYGLTGSKLLELNKQRDLARVKTDAERKAVAAAYDTMIAKAKAAELAQTKSAGAVATAMRTIQRAVVGVATSFIALQAIRITIGFGDQFAQLNGVLKLATHSTDEFARAQQGVLKIANETRAPVKETADTYAALERTTRRVGLSQDELLTALTTVNKAIALTPVSAQAAQATLTQFGQALGGDFKNGAQELNSILEQTPGLAIAIAKGLGVEVSQLKKMGEEGKLNTELVVRGLIRISDQVDKDFQNVPKTVSGVLQTIKNDLLFTIGSAGLQPLVDALEDLRRVVSDPAVVSGLTAIAAAIVKVTSVTVSAVSGIANFTKFVAESVAAFVNGISPDDLDRLGEKISDLKKRIADAEGGKNEAFGFQTEDVAELRAELAKTEAVYETARKAAEEFAIATAKGDAAARKAAAAAAADAEKKFKDAQAKLAAKSATSASLQQNAALLKDAADRAIAELDRVYAAGKIGFVDYVNAKLDATLKALAAERELAEFEAANADTAEARQKALTKISILQRDQIAAVNEATRERAEGQKQLAQELEDIQDRIAQAGGDNFAVRAREIDREREALLKKFANDPVAAGFINKLFDVETARARADSIRTEADRLIQDLQNKENSISNQISAGVISQAAGEQQLHDAREATIEQLIRQRDALQEVYNTAPSPDVLAAIEEFNQQIGEIGVRNATGMQRAMINLRTSLAQLQQDFAGDSIDALTDGLTNLFTSIASGSKSAGEALRDFVAGFAQAMLQIAARALATYLVLSILDAIYPGLGKATAAAMGARAGVHHTGGIAGRATTKRVVDPLLFAAAPRYHQGGVAGLAPDEVLAILQKGEEVLSKNDPRNVMNGGKQGSTPSGVRVVNVWDASFVADQMDSPAGEKVILNVIGRNPGSVKQLLG